MALTLEQFKKAQEAGFTTDQIIGFEKQRESPAISETKPNTEDKPLKNFWSGLGAEITPGMREQHPVLSAIAQTGQDVSAGSAAFLNQALFNAPRALVRKAGYEYAQPGESPVAKAAYYGGGVAGAVTSPITKTLGAFGLPGKAAGLGEKVVKGATAGAVAGAAYTPTEDVFAPGQRATQGVVGAFLGGVAPLAGKAASKVVETTKNGFQTLKGLKLPTTSTLEKEQFGLKVAQKARMSQLQESAQQAKYNLTQTGKATQQVFDNNYKVLSGKLKDASEEGVLNFQKSLPEFYKSVGESYNSALDNVATNMEITRGKLGLSEVNSILRKSLEEANNESLNYGKSYTKLNELWTGKYAESSSNLNKTFSLQEVKADIDQVFKLAKYGIRGTGEDIPAHILRKNWGQFITDETKNVYGVSDYAILQKKYSEVVDAMKLSDKLFKPKAGELYAEKGASFLRKFGMSANPSNSEQKLISMVEQGTELGQGVGNLSEPVKQIGAEIRAVKEANQIMKDNISQRLDKLNITSSQVRRSVSKEFETRIDDYTNKIMDRKKAVALARMLGLGTAAAVGAYGVGRGITNVAGFRESYGQ